MMTLFVSRVVRLTALACMLSASEAFAGQIKIDIAHGDAVAAMLNSDSKVFVDAFRMAIPEKGLKGPFTGRAKEHLYKATKLATVARMEYVYTEEGRLRSRTYYARSGPAMDVTFRRMSKRNFDDGSTGESSGRYIITDDDIALDIAEGGFYPRDTPLRARAPNLPGITDGVVANDAIHAGDAELKIFRKLESDIAAQAVPKGGRLVGYVSKSVCPSCKAASEKLAAAYDIDGNIFQLIQLGSESATNAAESESARLSGVLRRRRDDYLNRNVISEFAPLDRTSQRMPNDLERIEAEEARQTIALPCGD